MRHAADRRCWITHAVALCRHRPSRGRERRDVNVDELLRPISETNPTGVNMREAPGSQDLYYRLKDARSAARLAERALDPDEAMRVAPEWKEVDALAREALANHAKDTEVLAWLVEAALRLRGLEGLRDAFGACATLVERDFEALHAFDTDTPADRAAHFGGLNGAGAEGTLIQPLRFVALVPGEPFYQAGLWVYQTQGGGDESDLRSRARAAGPDAMRAQAAAAQGALDAFERLHAALDAACGPDAPPASNIRNVLLEVVSAIRDLGGLLDAPDAARDAAAEQAGPDGGASQTEAAGAPTAPPAPRGLQTREDAFAALMDVAEFFRRTEPHSPLSFSIETLVRRGRMSFPELLEELLPDNQARQLFLTSAGIKPQSDDT